MDYTKVFYWMVVADNAKTLFKTGIWVFTIIAIISLIVNFIMRSKELESEDDEDTRKAASISRRWMWWSIPFAFLFWTLNVLTPTTRESLLIIGGGQTLNYLSNNETAQKIPQKFLTFLEVQLDNYATEAGVELKLNEKKDKMLEEIKGMSIDEISERAKTDTVFASYAKEVLFQK